MKRVLFFLLLMGSVVFAEVIPMQNDDVNPLISGISLKNPDLSVYPNPARDFITVQAKHSSKIVRVSFYNILGTEILTKSINKTNEVKFNINKFKRGKYLVRVYFNDGTIAYTNLVKV